MESIFKLPRNHPENLDNKTEYPCKQEGGKRCNRIRRNGERCKNWAAPGFDKCWAHGAGRKHTMRRQRRYMFKSKTINELFESMASDPDRLDLTEELGLLRTILATVTERVESFSANETASIIMLASDITKTAGVLSRIEKDLETSVSIEQIQVIADQFISIIAKHVKDDTVLEAIQSELFEARVPNADGRFNTKGVR